MLSNPRPYVSAVRKSGNADEKYSAYEMPHYICSVYDDVMRCDVIPMLLVRASTLTAAADDVGWVIV
jgi:hypothetical protein